LEAFELGAKVIPLNENGKIKGVFWSHKVLQRKKLMKKDLAVKDPVKNLVIVGTNADERNKVVLI
jgi:hypothetical protein